MTRTFTPPTCRKCWTYWVAAQCGVPESRLAEHWRTCAHDVTCVWFTLEDSSW